MAGATMARLAAIAEQRWGLVTTEQAAAVDVTRNALTRLTASGALVRVAQGVYRMAGAPELENEGIYATWLALGGATRPATDEGVAPVVAAGVTAAILHGIGDFYPEQADFVVPSRRGTRLPARLRVRSLTPAEVTFAESVPTLTVERTIADLVGLWTDRSLVADALFSAYEQGKFVRPWQLVEYLEPLAGPAGFRDGTDFAADLLAIAGIRHPVTNG
ncbi:type IV toxin-antitoxin system AbiEi family antitoxin domain-containing protein [Microbacterium sp. M1A1_1b]